MLFQVEIEETLQKIVEIEAKDEHEAVEKIRKAYGDCEIVLDSENFVGHEIKLLEG